MQNPDKETLRRALKEELRRREGMREAAEGSLYEFIRLMWSAVEPARPFTEGWAIEAICEHLEAVTFGGIKRLLINVSPGALKSLSCNVFWPAWEWGPQNIPSMRYITASYSQSLTLRDNVRFRQVIMSPLYRQMWGDRFGQSKDQFNLIKVANDRTGWKLASSVGGVSTGERADRVVCLPKDVLIETDRGAITIGKIVDEHLDVLILSYDLESEKLEWQPVESWQKNPPRELYEIEIEDGSVVRLTYDHRVFIVGRGWVQACNIKEGDEVLTVDGENGLSL